MKSKPSVIFSFLTFFTLTFFVFKASAATWTGGSLVPTNLWSDINNWDSLAIPENQLAAFNNTGSTNVIGVVNNVLDTNLTITVLDYKAQVSFVGLITNYHTLQINPGVTLTIDNGATAGALINVGDLDSLAQDNQYYYTIIGTNGSLFAGNTNTPNAGQGLQVTAGNTAAASHIGWLNLSGLDNFTMAGGYFWVGMNNATGASTDRPVGKMYLARTNLIIANGSQTEGPFRLGESIGNTPSTESQLELGQDNTIYTAWMKVGGRKSGASQGGRIYFRASLTNNNPILKLRGSDGVSRLGIFSLGDNLLAGASSIGSRGTMDLSNGTVDALVDTANIARSANSTSASATGAASGTLTWTSGIFDITTLFLGYQGGNAPANATGTINVRGTNATLLVGSITMGRDAGSAAGKGTGTLNITSGGKVTVSGTISENNASGGNGTSTINVTDSFLNTADLVTVDNINLTSGTISNAALVTVTALKGTGTIYGPVTVLTNFNPGLPVGTLTISNDLVLSASSSNVFEFNLDTLLADKVAGLSNVTFNGTLMLTNIAGISSATNGTIFKLFDAQTYTGSFTVTNLPALTGGLTWDLSALGTNGTVKLISNVNTTPTNMVVQITGNNVEFSWPSDHIGWRLQAQTNSLSVGISNNWVTVTGTDSTNHFSTTIASTNETVFYRMIYP